MRNLSFVVVFLAFFAGSLDAGQAMPNQQMADHIFHHIIDAQVHKDYDAFIANGTLELKAALTKTQFDATSDLMNPRLKGGYEINPLGELNQRGFQVYLYRLRFKDGGDDILGTMSLKDGQVAGIYFK